MVDPPRRASALHEHRKIRHPPAAAIKLSPATVCLRPQRGESRIPPIAAPSAPSSATTTTIIVSNSRMAHHQQPLPAPKGCATRPSQLGPQPPHRARQVVSPT